MIGLSGVRSERFTLDTNILIYSVDRQAGPRHAAAIDIIKRATLAPDCWLTLQSVSEFYAATARKRLVPPQEAATIAAEWLELFPSLPSTAAAIRTALQLSTGGRASYWDALLIATAAEGGCTAVITEDLADGAVLAGVRIVHPFAAAGLTPSAHALLALA